MLGGAPFVVNGADGESDVWVSTFLGLCRCWVDGVDVGVTLVFVGVVLMLLLTLGARLVGLRGS
jgi:hypothetical protein